MDSGKVVSLDSVGSKRRRNDSQKKKKETTGRNDGPEDLEGYWYCRTCFSFNVASSGICSRNPCRAPGPTTLSSIQECKMVNHELISGYHFVLTDEMVSGGLSERALPDNRASGKHHGGPNGLSEGDWICPKCDFLNFSFRAICNRRTCRTPRVTHIVHQLKNAKSLAIGSSPRKVVGEEEWAHPTNSPSPSRGEARSSRREKKLRGSEREDSFEAVFRRTRVEVDELLVVLSESRQLESRFDREKAAQEIASFKTEVEELRSALLAAQCEKTELAAQNAELIMQRDDALRKLTERCAEVESLREKIESRAGQYSTLKETLKEMIKNKHMKLLKEIKMLRDQNVYLGLAAKEAIAMAEPYVLGSVRKGSEAASRVSGKSHSGGH